MTKNELENIALEIHPHIEIDEFVRAASSKIITKRRSSNCLRQSKRVSQLQLRRNLLQQRLQTDGCVTCQHRGRCPHAGSGKATEDGQESEGHEVARQTESELTAGHAAK